MRDCGVCGGKVHIYADFGFGPHMVSQAQVDTFNGPIKTVTYSVAHKSWCWTTDARLQRE